jgi:hypothetical protein
MTPNQAGLAIADRFVSCEYTGRDNLAMHISSAIQQAVREAYEDAARIAEGTDWHMDRPHTPVEILVAKAIRARISEKD